MTQEEEGTRKPRREAAPIYRPGMFKRGVDSTLAGEPTAGSKPPELPKRPTRISVLPLENARSMGRIDEVHRRKSNDTDSIHSYRNDSGSTTPDAVSMCSERKNSWTRGGGVRTFTRGGGKLRDSRDGTASQCSEQSFVSTSTRNEHYDRNNRRGPSQRFEPDSYSTHNKPYNSTQSLYNSRLPGGYLDSSDQRNRPLRQNLPTGQQRFVRNGFGNERSSMRAEGGQRRAPRRRNDSINSTQSEWPQPTQELHVDTYPETQSQAGDAPLSTASSVDYFAVCQSLESMGSFNWTEEMEQVELQKEVQERLAQEGDPNELQKKMESCKNGIELQKAITENKGRPIRGIIRLNIEDGPPLQSRPTENVHSSREHDRPPYPKYQRDKNRGQRQRRDSGSSSVNGSIVEEEENSDELATGERTPTDSRPSSSNEYRSNYRKSSRDREQYQHRPRTEPNAERVLPTQSTRLAGRLTTSGRNPMEGRGVYQPPGARRAANAVGVSSSLKSNRDSYNRKEAMGPKTNKEEKLYSQIAESEGPQIEKLNNEIGVLLPQVAEKKNHKAAEKLLQLSEKLRTIYIDVLTKDVVFTFTKNLEQHLWKQAFHKIIDSMKRGSNSVHENAKTIRALLLQFVDEAISYYTLLVSHLETTYDVSFEMALYWPNGLPADDFTALLHAERPVSYETSAQKIALKSISRHLLCIGDLYRYKSLVEGNEDYSASRGWYLKAAQLWPSSGHPYNQLAVVAFFSMLYTSTRRARHTPLEILSKQRQERVLDEIFFCIRAIGAGHSYEAAKDRLNGRLAAMRKKVEKYEVLLNSEQGRVKTELVEIGFDQREHWILPDSSRQSKEEEQGPASNPNQLHRRAVSYLIHTAGLLISKIGMETFPSISERAFTQLNLLLSIEDAPISAHQLIQFSLIFIYAVHSTSMKSEEGTFSIQQKFAVGTLVTYFGILLKQLSPDEVNDWFTGASNPSKQSCRVLPAISVICNWMKSLPTLIIFQTMPHIQPLNFAELTVNVWSCLCDLANSIRKVEAGRLLGSTLSGSQYIQQEILYVSSFFKVFRNVPEAFSVQLPIDAAVDASVHVRIRSILEATELLAESQVNCLLLEESSGMFVKSEDQEVPGIVLSRTRSDPSTETVELTRDDILSRERQNRVLLIVKPHFVVPDTNALLDHLSLFQKIVECGQFEALIPTIVLDELQGLSKPGMDAHSNQISIESKKCLSWLKEKVKEKNSNMHTLTTQGNKMAFRIMTEESDMSGNGRVNDDRILQSCASFLTRNPPVLFANVSVPKGTEAIYSNLVLLSEDRGICIKATSQHVPTKNIQNFVKWSKLKLS